MPSIASSVTRSQRWSYKKALLPCESKSSSTVLPGIQSTEKGSTPVSSASKKHLLYSLASRDKTIFSSVVHPPFLTTVPTSPLASRQEATTLPVVNPSRSSILVPSLRNNSQTTPAKVAQLTSLSSVTSPIVSPVSSQPTDSPLNNLRPLSPYTADTETSQTTVNLVSCYTESIQPSSHLDISNQSWVKSSTREITATSASPPVTTTYVRPIKLSRLVRTMFEEASIEYASAIRTAALFPDTHFSTSTTTTTTSTTASPKLPLCSK
ncbi:CCR4-NOT transcription complex subunit 11-like [Homarus americanus]|uniref:CCR4-NOT transcription complex subunit 11-like n=1 Tax=Homarus americanus TaxID=6706 RepID=UPI001C4728B0|nr:CCR4-NOT transcription complex subunit 11-like [Homarus americanus]